MTRISLNAFCIPFLTLCKLNYMDWWEKGSY